VATIRADRQTQNVDQPTAYAIAIVGEAPPPSPSQVTAVGAPMSAIVSWAAPAGIDEGSITEYDLVAIPASGDLTGEVTEVAPSGVHTARIRGLTPGMPYFVVVYAADAAGESIGSNPVQVTPTQSLSALGNARNIAVDAQGNPDGYVLLGTLRHSLVGVRD
jgi:CBS domain-containing protein